MKYNVTCKYTYGGERRTIKGRITRAGNPYYYEWDLVEMKRNNATDLNIYDDEICLLAEFDNQYHEVVMNLDEEFNSLGFKRLIIWGGKDNDVEIDVLSAFEVTFTSKSN